MGGRVETIGDATLCLGDCLELMRKMPDNAYDLAIVDPPYGDAGEGAGATSSARASADGSTSTRWGGGGLVTARAGAVRGPIRQIRNTPPQTANHAHGGRAFAKYSPSRGGAVSRTGGTWAAKYSPTGGLPSAPDIRHWDVAPPPEYFDELFRVSRHQIIWGGNYFGLPPSRNFIVWRKLTISERFSMAMAEYAWTSIPGNAKVFECAPQDSERFHPTQKPVALYRWLLSLYAKPGDRILDTHMGSGSSVVACVEQGYPIVAAEIAETYYDKAVDRIRKSYVAVQGQPRLFADPTPKPRPIPQELPL